ncbi:MAG: DUF2459 domain-containing protein [Balneolaceae bacterium]
MDLNSKAWFVLAPLFALLLTGCLGAVKDLYPEERAKRPYPVWVMSVGWHTAIVIESEYIESMVPLQEHLAPSRYYKVGWGDGRYYPSEDPGGGLLLRAALWPTRSVLHVTGLNQPPEEVFPGSEIILVHVSEEGVERIAEFIRDRFRRNDEGVIKVVADGLYANALFFDARGRYYLPKTSNHWTARALRQSGVPVTPIYAFTAGNLMRQSRTFGEVLKRRE